MTYLTPRPNHRDHLPYMVYLLDKSLADYIAGDLSFGMLANDIEGFFETVENCFDQRFGWQATLEFLYWTISIPYFSDEAISDERLRSVHIPLSRLRSELAQWWSENIHASD